MQNVSKEIQNVNVVMRSGSRMEGTGIGNERRNIVAIMIVKEVVGIVTGIEILIEIVAEIGVEIVIAGKKMVSHMSPRFICKCSVQGFPLVAKQGGNIFVL